MVQRDTDYKDKWQRMRLLATITIQPHLGKGKKVTPEKLLPFPWEKQEKAQRAKEIDPEAQRKRMKELVARLGDELIK